MGIIRVGFGTNERFHSRLIRWATESRWSHTWLEYESILWRGIWVAHAAPHGVVKVQLAKVLQEYPVNIRFSYEANLTDGFAWARDYIGAPYDYGAIWNGLLYAAHRVTKWQFLHNVVSRNTSKHTCSEFVAGFLKASKTPGFEGLDPELIPPGDLFNICTRTHGFELLPDMQGRSPNVLR